MGSFLNPFEQYRDRLTLYILSSNPIEVEDAKGRGPGWGTAYFNRLEYTRELEAILEKDSYGFLYQLLKITILDARTFIRVFKL